MGIAIISDIHANLEALNAVLEDIEKARLRYGITETHCLGDIVNYGANPSETIELVRKNCAIVLRGNHDEAVANADPTLLTTFHREAAKGALWTRKQLTNEQLSWLASRPYRHLNNGLAEVHGTLCAKLEPYDLAYSNDQDKNLEYAHLMQYCDTHRMSDEPNVIRCFESMIKLGSKVCAIGHVQMAECYVKTINRHFEHVPMTAKQPEGRVSVSKKIEPRSLYIFDVGAVGQPRDDDPRASYGIYTGDQIIIRRVPYEIQTAMLKILETPLSKRFAFRLQAGH